MDWKQFVSGIVTVLFSSGTVLFLLRWLRELRRSRLERRYKQGVRAIAAVFHHMQSLLNRTPAHRVMVLKVENGGGVPGPGRDVYSTLVHETHDQELPSLQGQWFRRPLDTEYSDMIIRVMEKSRDTIVTSKLKQESVIRTLYLSQGIQRGEIFRLCMTEKAFYYVSIVMKKDEPLTDEELFVVSTAIDALRQIFSEYHHVIDPRWSS